MKILLFIFVSLISLNVNATYSYTSTAWGFSTSTSTDLNTAYLACDAAKTDIDDVCLWFAVGDTVAMSNTSNSDYLVTIDAGHEGWYKLRKKTVDKTGYETLVEAGFYLDQYFYSTNTYAYRSSVVADIDGQTEYRARYQGFFDFNGCPSGSNQVFYPEYTGSNLFAGNNVYGGIYQLFSPSYFDTYLPDTQSNTVTRCTDPTQLMGISCAVSITGTSQNPFSASHQHQGAFVLQAAATLTRCDDIANTISTPVREYLTGSTVSPITGLLFEDEIKNDTFTQLSADADIDGVPEITNTTVKYKLHELIINDINAPDVDTDGDGVLDSLDAFPNDPLEWSDSDNDGVGNNADAFPYDNTETTDTDGDGTGDNSDIAPTDSTIGGVDQTTTGGGTATTSTTTTDNLDGTTSEEGIFELPDWTPTGTTAEYLDRSLALVAAVDNLDLAINNGVSSIETLFTPSFPASGAITCDAGVTSSQGINVKICWTDYVQYISYIGIVILLMASFQSIRILLMG